MMIHSNSATLQRCSAAIRHHCFKEMNLTPGSAMYIYHVVMKGFTLVYKTLQPYQDEPDNYGLQVTEPDALLNMTLESDLSGLQVLYCTAITNL